MMLRSSPYRRVVTRNTPDPAYRHLSTDGHDKHSRSGNQSGGGGGWWTSKKFYFGVASVLRVVLIIYGIWHDGMFPSMKYTDVDYRVFTAASEKIVHGNSPFEIPTYRYTPLLALLLTPNIFIHSAFGKVIFVLADVGVGVIIYKILKTNRVSPNVATACMCCWLFNPFTAAISTRGNAESVLAFLILATLHTIQVQRFWLAGILFACSFHMKIYPIIYLPSIILILYHGKLENQNNSGLLHKLVPASLEQFVPVVKFLLSSAITIGSITLVCFLWCGWPFLENSIFYHLTRRDPRHNFSPLFYLLYLTFDSPYSRLLGFAAFVPQFGLVIYAGIKYYRDLPFCWFVQTCIFVMFNKVCTSQYFVWFWCLFPLIIPQSTISVKQSVVLGALWLGSQGLWLNSAYGLEFEGHDTFLRLWGCGLLFFVCNAIVLVCIILKHRVCPFLM
eukprot:m.166299 g.166299  ORF g.166299 m.166299 type:complete len:446 (-) comp31422_c0_seq3:59-1396(-)